MRFRIAALVIAFLSAPIAAYADAGRFQFVFGKVEIVGEDGSSRVAKRGSMVREGETIRTSRQSSAQLKMVDGAALAVRPRTEVRLDEYSYERKPSKDRSFFSLVRGTFRAITGLIGRDNRDSYKVSTATATIGIRGSDGLFGHNQATGLTAVRTFDGGYSLTAPDQNGDLVTIQVNPGQIAIAQPGQAPTFATTFPFAANTQPPKKNASQEEGDGDDSDEEQTAQSDEGDAREGEGDDSDKEQVAQSNESSAQPGDENPVGDLKLVVQAGDPNLGDGPGDISITPGDINAGQLSDLSSSSTLGEIEVTKEVQKKADAASEDDGFPPPGTVLGSKSAGGIGAYIRVDPIKGPLPETGTASGNSDDVAIFLAPGPGGQFSVPIGIRDSSGGSEFEFLGTGAVLSPVESQVIFDSTESIPTTPVAATTWGFFSDSFRIKENGQLVNAAGPFHFGTTDKINTNIPLENPGFTYAAVGGSATNEVGAVADNILLGMSGTFDSTQSLGTINSFDVRVTFPTNSGSNNWYLTKTGTPTVSDFINNNIVLSGQCCGGTLPSPPSIPSPGGAAAVGTAAGLFVGPNADGVITAVAATAGNNQSLTGVVIGQRDSVTPSINNGVGQIQLNSVVSQ